jgi:pyruvate dehydrogenase E1 component alpha subunit
MNIGSFHEALNMAGIWGRHGLCPALFVIENNGYAMGTAVDRHSALTDLAARFDAYAIPNEKVDGQDVVAVHELAERAVATIRATGRPFCIEAQTYRFSGHGAADILQPYRPKQEVEQQKQRDPIRLLITRLTEERLVTSEEIEAMEAEAQQIAQRAVEYADQSPLPEPSELFTHIVSDDWSSADTRDDVGEEDGEEGGDA